MSYFVGVSRLRWGRRKTRTPHGLTRTWRQKRLYEVFPMWPGLLGRLLYHQDHLQSRGTLLHRPGEGRCDEGDVFLLAIWLYCLSHKAWTAPNGRVFAGDLDIKTLGCVKAEECGVETTVQLFANKTIFVITKHCCDTPFCNSAHKLLKSTFFYPAVAFLATWHITEASASS